ncbi:hypothetical protein KUTeg_003407 [Tegillarca granosa]|uniref:t-SNARE coiled-coil homology domain-containing protein n=1 Tax=Tegillarca granosa TaxID=220873 RepID=A0ABQ9FNP1_TEGGR|nr:hypothetical protein KUTeg_003407 [Tegillarca granosa]
MDRYNLMGSTAADTFGSGDPWGMRDEPEEFQGVSNEAIRQQQQHIIREQDQGLESLSHVIARQKEMATDIGNEVDSQNVLIDEITDHVDRTGERLIKETRHIRIVDRKSNTCCKLLDRNGCTIYSNFSGSCGTIPWETLRWNAYPVEMYIFKRHWNQKGNDSLCTRNIFN